MTDILARALDRIAPTKRGWEHFRELRSHTGRAGERYADALAIQCWPSRGLGAVGFELKVSRSDWLRELNKPKKSASIQRWCRAWWIVTTPGIVKTAELPETWGLVEVAPKKVVIMQQAPALEAEEPGWEFVCSVLRNRAEAEKRIEAAAHKRGYEVAAARYGSDRVLEIENALGDAQHSARKWERAAEGHRKTSEQLQQDIGVFEQLTGVQLRSSRFGSREGGPRSAARAVRLADSLMKWDLFELEGRLAQLTRRVQELAQQIKDGGG